MTEIGVEWNAKNITSYGKEREGEDIARDNENHMQKIFTCKDIEWWEGTQGTKNDQRIKQEVMNGTGVMGKNGEQIKR